MIKRTSLLRKYLLIIFIAIILLPLVLPVSSFLFLKTIEWTAGEFSTSYSSERIEKEWRNESETLDEDNPEEIVKAFQRFKEKYPEGTMFWVDRHGKTTFQIPDHQNIPKVWSASDAIVFMKKSFAGDPFTIVSYIGKGKKEAFMVFQVPRKYTQAPIVQIRERYEFVFETIIIVSFTIFVIISVIFFLKIRKRLLKLQNAMELPKDKTLPSKISITKQDEIGLLEESFNYMIEALQQSRVKEKQEEEFRRKLIADLSHDLRTPLTTMRAQIDSLKGEVFSIKGQETMVLMDEKINYIAELIENLLSYSLITAKKYPYHPKHTDMTRLIRKIIAAWYDSLEEEGFEVDIQIPEKQLFWNIDENWFQRMIDNVIQNVVRHASIGKFIGICIDYEEEMITIIDRGSGFQNTPSKNKGAGIGLSIIAVMAKEMRIEWSIESDDSGATFRFKKQ
ncbi:MULTISPECIES: sensor histidine kinase KdpD [unclassified Bacillus cereus group]|uniref:sensor histidine kinase n=1 Tax=unclassified Bacillus cereus group TaxID=2750818 RepID=UPI001F5A6402|nr:MULTISPECIES: HAMP domain-containing sensor histidine kinase [unclassified Bacillus cereus group]